MGSVGNQTDSGILLKFIVIINRFRRTTVHFLSLLFSPQSAAWSVFAIKVAEFT